ncbi:hypothetical protein [Kitasatospora sp. NPDC096204]|uniref:hypothetical protein n=1 Tax=Kitasatospora sp. NPDC096204 TaxID=3364094 RepID=UPI0037F3EB4F
MLPRRTGQRADRAERPPRLPRRTPALLLRATTGYDHRAQALLTDKLLAQDPVGDELTARIAAAQLLAAQLTLTGENQRRLLAGGRAADALPTALDQAHRAFALIEHGLGDYGSGAA